MWRQGDRKEMKRRNRHERILELLQTSALDIDRLAEMLEVSVATIRRDLARLAEQGKMEERVSHRNYRTFDEARKSLVWRYRLSSRTQR
jgi:DeoR/GlpR family transcriptional regulator of sugar metabolism